MFNEKDASDGGYSGVFLFKDKQPAGPKLPSENLGNGVRN